MMVMIKQTQKSTNKATKKINHKKIIKKMKNTPVNKHHKLMTT